MTPSLQIVNCSKLVLNDSKGRGLREQGAVDRVNDWLGSDLTAAEESAIETLNRVFTALDTFEFKINVALGICIKSDMNNFAIFLTAFGTDIFFKLFDPTFCGFPTETKFSDFPKKFQLIGAEEAS